MNDGKNKAMVLKEEAKSLLPHIEAALPSVARKYMTPERLVKVALSAISRNPTLLACSKESILRAMIDAATLGLELAGPLGHVYAVPYRNKKNGQYEMIPIVGYQGYLELARRSGKVAQVYAHVVYSGDVFDIDLGSGKPPVHKVRDWKARGEPRLVYCVARFSDGNHHVEVMTLDEVEAIRARSQAKDSGPWVTDYLEMAKKTVVRRARKYWPMIPELALAAEIDERAVEAPSVVDYSAIVTSESEPEGRVEEVKAAMQKQTLINTEEHTENGIKDLYDRAKAVGVPDDVWNKMLKDLGITRAKESQTNERLDKLESIVADWEAAKA